MIRIIALLSIAARCAAFGSTFSTSSGGACIDEPAHLIAEETAKLGGEFAQYTSCDGIAAAGGCGVAIVKVVCCATCADVRAPRSGRALPGLANLSTWMKSWRQCSLNWEAVDSVATLDPGCAQPRVRSPRGESSEKLEVKRTCL